MSTRVRSRRFRGAVFASLAILLSGCGRTRSADIAAFGADGTSVGLLAADARSAGGVLRTDEPGELRFSFAVPLAIPPYYALELEYVRDAPASDLQVVFRSAGESAWALPRPGSSSSRTIRYRFPLVGSSLSSFSIRAEAAGTKKTEGGSMHARSVPNSGFRLVAVRVGERAYGYEERDGIPLLTPYVYREEGSFGKRIVIDPPEPHLPYPDFGIRASFSDGRSTIATADPSVAFAVAATASGGASVSIPGGALPGNPFPIVIESATFPRSALALAEPARVFPREPIPADPATVLAYRRGAWRNDRYEVFRWERFPRVLIFDTADYAVQDRLFKRIAFYVEKAGFRGRLATDAEIAGLHGWNAHDYRAEDLAAFFETARKTGFPLNAEERELFAVLQANGLVERAGESGPVEAGSGAVVSVSRESAAYLRNLFMVHEGYHGIFFVDGDFRRFAGERWDALDPAARRFIKAYFDMHRYDVGDRYLMMNELMAYCLQQPAAAAATYFGSTLPSRLEKDARRRLALPAKDEENLRWPDLARLFAAEAAAFDSYVKDRWGLRAGSVSSIYQISRTNAAR